MKPETLCLHKGFSLDPTTKSCATPIYQTVAYEFDSAEHGANLFNLSTPGNIYTRIMNPTWDVLEQRIAALEGGIAAMATASGSAAVNYAILNIAAAGDNIVSAPQLYGGTHTLFQHNFPRLGIEVRFAKSNKAEDWAALIDKNTKALYCETIGNPSGIIADIAALADIAHSHGVPLIVDNTVATPILCRPIEHGADIVLHSLTKFVGGHGTTLGGIIVDSGKFPWGEHAERFPVFSQPEPAYHDMIFSEAFGPAAYIARSRTVDLRNTGAALSPLSAFLLLQGVETLSLRMERHCQNALELAQYLQKHEAVEWVSYAGLPEDEQYALAQKYCSGKPSSLLTFGLRGGKEAAAACFDALAMIKRLVNIGDTKTLCCHPASTTHSQMNEQELAKAGVAPEALRLCVGIEHIDDIISDLEQAFSVAHTPSGIQKWGTPPWPSNA